QAARTSTLAKYESDTDLARTRVVDYAAGNGHGGHAARWDNVEDDIGAQRRDRFRTKQRAVGADLAQVGVCWLGIAGEAKLDRQAYGNSRMPSTWTGLALSVQGLEHEIALGPFFGRELDQGTGPHPQPGQGGPPGHH